MLKEPGSYLRSSKRVLCSVVLRHHLLPLKELPHVGMIDLRTGHWLFLILISGIMDVVLSTNVLITNVLGPGQPIS